MPPAITAISGSALELFAKARELFTREHNDAWVATIDLYQALVFYQEGHLREARHAVRRPPSEFFSQSPLVGRAVLSQLILARIYLDSGRPEVARAICMAALQSLRETETPALSYQALFVLGLIEEALHLPAQAYDAYLKAHSHLENLRSHLRAEEVKIAFLKDKQEVYESLVRMSLAGETGPESVEAAFQFIEQAKSRSLADLIAFGAKVSRRRRPPTRCWWSRCATCGSASTGIPAPCSCRKAADPRGRPTPAIRNWNGCAGRRAIASRS